MKNIARSYGTYVGKTTGDGRSTEAGSGTRCGRPGRRVPGASSGPGRPSCSPPWLRPGCTRHWALRAERTLSGSHIPVPPEARGHRETPLGGYSDTPTLQGLTSLRVKKDRQTRGDHDSWYFVVELK